ncbi:MAG: ligase-associated DNA damage response endonuclease PdeM [Aquabacterium sp.]
MTPAAPMALSPAARITLAGHVAHLLPQRALYLAEFDALLVADVHLGKAASFRRLGVPVPEATTAATLRRLDDALAACSAGHLVVLGDLLHSALALPPGTLASVQQWRERQAGLRITLVRGNHDQRSGDPPDGLKVDCRDGPIALGRLQLVHDPAEAPVAANATAADNEAGYVLAGHVHPAVVLGGRARSAVRLPCFHFGPSVGVLPAFGDFTGSHVLPRGPDCRIYAVAEGRVVAV